MESSRVMKVAVIGGGLVGLSCLRHLVCYPDHFKVQAFEQTNEIGGTWVYTDKTGVNKETELHIQSSMYKYLRYIVYHQLTFLLITFQDKSSQTSHVLSGFSLQRFSSNIPSSCRCTGVLEAIC